MSILLIFVLASLGLQITVGKIRHCTDARVFDKANCVPDEMTPGRRWEAAEFHMDWIGPAVLTMFALLTWDSFERVAGAGTRMTSSTTGPAENGADAPAVLMFYMFAGVVSSIVLKNLFIACLCNAYVSTCAEEREKTIQKAKHKLQVQAVIIMACRNSFLLL